MSVVLRAVVLTLGPVLVLGLAWLLLLAPSPLRQRMGEPLVAASFVVRRRARALLRRPDPAAAEPEPAFDPFDALGVQLALARLNLELETLARDEGVFARGFRVAATQAAYDDVLAQACVLAEVPLQRGRDDDRRVGRMLEETQLAQRGWFW